MPIWFIHIRQHSTTPLRVERDVEIRPVPRVFPGFWVRQRVELRCKRSSIPNLQKLDLVVVSGTACVEYAPDVGQVADVHEDVDVVVPRQHIVHDVRAEQRAVRQHVRDVELGQYGVDLRQQLDASVTFLTRNQSWKQLVGQPRQDVVRLSQTVGVSR